MFAKLQRLTSCQGGQLWRDTFGLAEFLPLAVPARWKKSAGLCVCERRMAHPCSQGSLLPVEKSSIYYFQALSLPYYQILHIFLAVVNEMWPPLPMKLGVWAASCNVGGLKNSALHAPVSATFTEVCLHWRSVRMATLAHLHSVGVFGDLRECRGLGRSTALPPPPPPRSFIPHTSMHHSLTIPYLMIRYNVLISRNTWEVHGTPSNNSAISFNPHTIVGPCHPKLLFWVIFHF